MDETLKSKTVRAISWSFIDSMVMRGVRFIVGILLARTLFPKQFGLIGMLAIFFAVAQAFLLSGFGSALIQKKEATQTDMCSIFYFNILVGILAAILLCLGAPWIASFYNQPILDPMTKVLSVTLVVNSFGVIHTSTIIKQINFRLLTKVTFISSVLSGTFAVLLAVKGFGVWSLVMLQVSNSFLRTVSLWCINTWRPSWIFSVDALKNMFGFGSRMLASNLLNQFFSNIYYIVIGKSFSASDLGYFTRAKSLQELPSNTLSDMVARVTFPVFSTIQDDPARIKNGMKKVITGMVLFIFPLMVGLAVISKPLVLLLLTDKWSQSIPYIQLMCVVGIFYPLQMINVNVLTSIGRPDIVLKNEFINKALLVLSIVVTVKYGIKAMIYGMIVVAGISYYINSYFIKKHIDYSIVEQIIDVMPYMAISLFMGFIVYMIGMSHLHSLALLVSIQLLVGGIAYISLCWIFRLAIFMDILSMNWKGFMVMENKA